MYPALPVEAQDLDYNMVITRPDTVTAEQSATFYCRFSRRLPPASDLCLWTNPRARRRPPLKDGQLAGRHTCYYDNVVEGGCTIQVEQEEGMRGHGGANISTKQA